MKIVAMLNVKNEEWIIRQNLEALTEVVDEVVVVDDASTDHTVEILRSFPQVTRIHQKSAEEARYRNEVADRTIALNLAREQKADWILYLDADEIFDVRMKDKIRDLVRCDSSVGGYNVTRIQLWDGITHYRIDNNTGKAPHFRNHVLVRMTPQLKWVSRYGHITETNWSKRGMDWKQVIKGYFIKPRKYKHGARELEGFSGPLVNIDEPVMLHYEFADFPRSIKRRIRYALWHHANYPELSDEEIVNWAYAKLDTRGLEVAPVKPEWGEIPRPLFYNESSLDI